MSAYFDGIKPRRWHNWNCIQNVNWRYGTREYLNHVRESHVTARVNIDRYYDYENGVYLLDKMPSLSPISWDDLIETEGSYGNYRPLSDSRFKKEEAWFTPKDNDFEEECRRDEEEKERKLAAEKAEKEEKAYQERVRQRELELQEIAKQRAELQERIKQKEREYELLKERQRQTAKQIYAHSLGYVVKNKWNPR